MISVGRIMLCGVCIGGWLCGVSSMRFLWKIGMVLNVLGSMFGLGGCVNSVVLILKLCMWLIS